MGAWQERVLSLRGLFHGPSQEAAMPLLRLGLRCGRHLLLGGVALAVDELTAGMSARGWAAEALHGDMKQSQRDRIMDRFRRGRSAFWWPLMWPPAASMWRTWRRYLTTTPPATTNTMSTASAAPGGTTGRGPPIRW